VIDRAVERQRAVATEDSSIACDQQESVDAAEPASSQQGDLLPVAKLGTQPMRSPGSGIGTSIGGSARGSRQRPAEWPPSKQ
jgi:hypothetical protein